MNQFLSSNAKDKVLIKWQSLKLTPYESTHKYVDKFWDLHLKSTVYKKIDFEEQKEQFCVGLPKDMNEYVNSQRPTTISTVIHHTMVAARINFQQGAKINLKPMDIKEKDEPKGKNHPQNYSKELERLEQAVRDQSPLRARTMGRPPANGGPVFRFLPNEVATMEKTLEDFQGNAPSKEAMQGLADAFSISAERAGKTMVQYKQVWNWFQNRRHAVKKSSKVTEKPIVAVPQAPVEVSVPKRAPTVVAVPSGGKVIEPQKMEFEAKSSRDKACLGFIKYDPIISFRDHSIRLYHNNQELELRGLFTTKPITMVSAMQVKRLVRKRDCTTALVMLREAEDDIEVQSETLTTDVDYL
ncbi:hypothetical protein L7F22_036694 [Adiantum nelumboides]|nr:hypothetical protein [Adiantum nelumboides]